jgi:hypothetical protein
MPLAIVEKIAVEIYDRLSAMVGDSTTYPTDVIEVVRPTRFANFTPRDRQVIITQGVASPVPEFSCPGNPPAVAIAQQFNIRLHLMPSERNADAIDTLLNQFASDVRKCICQPASSWHTFDGNALFGVFGNQITFTSDGGLEGGNLPLIVTYRVSEDDPTELR